MRDEYDFSKAIKILKDGKYNIDKNRWSQKIRNNFRRECNKTLEDAIQALKKEEDE